MHAKEVMTGRVDADLGFSSLQTQITHYNWFWNKKKPLVTGKPSRNSMVYPFETFLIRFALILKENPICPLFNSAEYDS